MIKTIPNDQISITFHAIERFALRELKLKKFDKEEIPAIEHIIRTYMPDRVLDVDSIRYKSNGMTFIIKDKQLVTVYK